MEAPRRTAPLLSLLALYLLYLLAVLLRSAFWANLLSPLLCFFVFGSVLAMAPKAPRPRRLHWLLMALVPLLWGIGEGLWALWPLISGASPESSPLLMGIYSAASFSVAFTVVFFSIYERRDRIPLQFIVDSAAIFAVTLGLLYFVFFDKHLGKLFSLSAESLNVRIDLFLDLLSLTFAFSGFLGLGREQRRASVGLVYAAVAVFGCSDALYAYQLLSGSYLPNGLVDSAYLLSMALLGCGALLFRAEAGAGRAAKAGPGARQASVWMGLALLLVPASLGLVRGFQTDVLSFFIAVILLYQAMSAILRKLSSREEELLEKSRQAELLEMRVRERTAALVAMNAKLENLTKRDAITGQYNRRYFLDQSDAWIGELLSEGAAEDERLWMLIMDFDRFKSINDTYGHDVGDEALRAVARRLEPFTDERTLLARLGGDEFGMVCRRLVGEPIDGLMAKIGEAISEPLQLGPVALHLSASIGAACFPADSKSRSDLMSDADMAMYEAKSRRIKAAAFFNPALSRAQSRRHKVELYGRRPRGGGPARELAQDRDHRARRDEGGAHPRHLRGPQPDGYSHSRGRLSRAVLRGQGGDDQGGHRALRLPDRVVHQDDPARAGEDQPRDWPRGRDPPPRHVRRGQGADGGQAPGLPRGPEALVPDLLAPAGEACPEASPKSSIDAS